MINIWWAKRWVSYILTGSMTLATFILLIFMGTDFWISIAVSMLATILLGVISRRLLLAHPYIDYLEGKGLIVKTLDSTGLIKTFLVDLEPPFLKGMLNEREVEDVFDRNAMMYETPPKKAKGRIEKDRLIIEIPHDKAHVMQFREHVYPVFIWNENLKTFLTKESLAKLEADAILDHALLYLMRKVEEMNSHLRDFGRYVMDTTKPAWFSIREFIRRHPFLTILILVLVIGAIVIMFFPAAIQGMATEALPAPETGTAGAVQPVG